jgi:hypothetical protein
MDSRQVKIALGLAELTLLLGVGDREDGVENVDAVLTLEDGSRWSATVLSLAEITALMERWRESGEYLSGRYFTCPDLVIVREAGVSNIAEVFSEILRTGGPEGILLPIE